MMHLRDIEKSFGKDFLKILSYWEPLSDDEDGGKKDIYNKIYAFFKTDNEKERERLKKELLLGKQS
jgi:hypothetical protein